MDSGAQTGRAVGEELTHASRQTAVRWLGERSRPPGRGTLARLELLARAGLPVPEGIVITHHAHEELLRASSLGRYLLRASSATETDARRWAASLRSSHGAAPLGDALKSTVCEALIELRARSVAVISDYGGRCGLQSIPEVVDAVRAHWLSPEGLERQIRASSAGKEMPTWPVLVQREIRAELTGWTAAEPGSRHEPGLYGVSKPSPLGVEQESLRELALEAQAALDESARIEWGLSGGEWYILGVRPAGAADSPSPASQDVTPGSRERAVPERLPGTRLAAYVGRLGLQECLGILAASTVSLSDLVELDEQSRVRRGEGRTFEEVIRMWTIGVLFVEGDFVEGDYE